MLKFRKLEDKDFSLIEKWLNKEHVRRWYEIPEMGITIDDWMAEIKAYQGEFQWITYLIVLMEDCPIGMCLYYKCKDSEGEEFGNLQMEGSYGIDYLLGEESQLRKGIGREMVTLLTDKIFAIPGAQRVTADVDPENAASARTLLASGFEPLEPGLSRYVKQNSKGLI